MCSVVSLRIVRPTPHFMGRYTPFSAFSPSFIVKMPLSYSQQTVAVNLFFSFLVLLFFFAFFSLIFLFPLLLSISKPKNCPPIEVCGNCE